MSKDTEQTKLDAEVAQFRFALIAPVVQRLYPDASATAYYKRVTRNPFTLPDDSTITIDNVCYDVPIQFISAKVDVRYLPDDMTSAYILCEDKKYPLRKTNRNDNCHTKRSRFPAIDYSKAGGDS